MKCALCISLEKIKELQWKEGSLITGFQKNIDPMKQSIKLIKNLKYCNTNNIFPNYISFCIKRKFANGMVAKNPETISTL